jgi:hypothetical protein
LSSWRPDGCAFAAIQHAELQHRQVRCAAHDAAQGINFTDNRTFGDTTDSGVARHLADGFERTRY